ncbi:hypothetical protein [Sphingobacterium griseoflavum]|uniref:Auto-transporter adhesin head GIN domain-containing protein n=1 Tax=Sphingobacterium griseoflavum TaxID=1474952 RepID=A0ABQ3HWR2_9SPHI|nr:hypothetical protein [Sphingobacterium griseoflavum]GHE42256.1 hypothetical protein GCM10017764_26890 [Sphingobacterium griseoflavum]
MKLQKILPFLLVLLTFSAFGQVEEQHISKLVLKKKEKKTFNNRDSSAIIYIDTLVMKDRSSLQFYGKKDVKLIVKYAEIGKRVFMSGIGAENNASNFDIAINLQKLGSLYVVASGRDANNGTRTFDNGDGGEVNFRYSVEGLTPQSEDKKAANYLHIDVSAGGRRINPNTDLNQIYSQIAISAPGLRGVPQGQIYSGSPGREGKYQIVKDDQ